jgi:hypothetical protein
MNDDSLYQTTDEYGDAFEVEWDEAEERYYVTVHDRYREKGSSKSVEAVSSLTPEQMRALVLAVGSHIEARGGS